MCSGAGIPPNGTQRLTLKDAVVVIEFQNASGYLADLRARNDYDAVQRKMVCPLIGTWVEEAAELSGLPDDGPDISSFEPIAERTRVGQVFLARRATVLLADDVIDFAAEERIVFVNQAVFAEIPGPLHHDPA
jgi:hypothetical protein